MRFEHADWELIKQVVGEALDADPDHRRALIEDRCAGRPSIAAEVESLIGAADSSSGVLSRGTDAWLGVGPGPASSRTLTPGSRVGGYEVEGLISEGPSSIVYRARQLVPDRPVAIKVLRPSHSSMGAAERFLREAVALGRIDHPGVARIYEAGMHRDGVGAGAPFIAMEFVDGVPITEYVRAHRPSRSDVLRLLVRVALGVQAAHQRAVIHRDLKPANVLVRPDGQPKVLDFGIARLLEEASGGWATIEGSLLGTPGYLSPEQAQGRTGEIDVRTDVWALGVLGYELLTGRAPIDVERVGPLEALRRVGSAEIVPPGRIDASLRGDIEQILMKSLRREQGQRYPSAQAFADDIERALSSLPIMARPPSVGYRFSRFAYRHRYALCGAVSALLVAGAAGFSQVSAWRRAGMERDRARAVNVLLRDMISAADPNFGNRSITLRDALSGIEARANAAGLPPLVEADARSALAAMFFSIGEYERAHAHVERAVELREQLSDRRGLVEDRSLLANALRWLYRPEEAIAVAARGVEEGRRWFGPSAPQTLQAMEIYAGCLHDLQRFEEAEAAYRQVVAAARSWLGPADERTLFAMGGLSSVLTDRGRVSEAEALIREVLEIRGARGPGAVRETLTMRGNLAMLLAEQGRLKEAIAEQRAVADAATTLLGEAHDVTTTTLTNLAESLRRSGEVDESIRIGRELLDRCVRVHGWGYDGTLDVAEGLISTSIRLRRFEEARALAELALHEIERTLGREHAWHHRQRALLAGALAGLGRLDEALDLYQQAIAYFASSVGPRHVQSLTVSNNYGTALIESERADEAVKVFDDLLARLSDGSHPSMVPVIRRNLGRALLVAGRTDEGVAALVQAYKASTARQELENARRCALLLSNHFAASGDVARAAEWAAKAGAPSEGAGGDR